MDGVCRSNNKFTFPFPVRKMQLATPFVGTIKYSSKRALTRHNQGPADDFISVIYIVAELISGKLPWRAIKNIDECAIMKQKFPQSIQYKRLPRELRVIYQSVHSQTLILTDSNFRVPFHFSECCTALTGSRRPTPRPCPLHSRRRCTDVQRIGTPATFRTG
jgi:serine/threonine protein kinase